jgi:site-specific recombinase XerD
MINSDVVSTFAKSLAARGKLPATVESYARDAQGFIEYLNTHRIGLKQVTPDFLVAYQDYLTHDRQEHSNSVRRSIIGIRQFFRHLADAKVITMTPLDAMVIPPRDDSLSPCLTPEDIESLIHAAGEGLPLFKAARDTAILSLLCFDGVKANELIALTWGDLIQTNHTWSLRLPGSRERSVILSETSKSYLEDYEIHMQTLIREPRAAIVRLPMFIAYRGRDSIHFHASMTRHGLKFILYELGTKAGLTKLNSEQLRHFAIQQLILSGKSPEEIMAQLGLRRLGNIAKHFAKARQQNP